MTSEELGRWLKQHKCTQLWLAKELSRLLGGEPVSHITVNGWVTGRKRKGGKKRPAVAQQPPRWLPFVLPHVRKED